MCRSRSKKLGNPKVGDSTGGHKLNLLGVEGGDQTLCTMIVHFDHFLFFVMYLVIFDLFSRGRVVVQPLQVKPPTLLYTIDRI